MGRSFGIFAAYFLVAAISGSLPAHNASAQSIQDMLERAMERHERVLAAREQETAADERRLESLSVYYPDLTARSYYGRERRENPSFADTILDASEIGVSITQRLYDFGASGATYRLAELRKERAGSIVNQVEQQVLLDGMRAYVRMARSQRVVEFARQSVENIKRQADLENERVEQGGGFSTDVLQAKTQLAGAKARLVIAEGDLQRTRNEFRAVFYTAPKSIPDVDGLHLQQDILPYTLDEAIAIALDRNPALTVASLDQDLSKAAIDRTRAETLYPTIDLIGEQIWKDNAEGIEGAKGEAIIKVELNYSFDLGFTSLNSIRASKADFRAANRVHGDLGEQVEEQVRNAWSLWQTARRNAELLENQARIAGEFLTLAREERKAGRRSLIDVLAGETALINAQSDAIAARADVTIASLTLLATMGMLDTNTLKQRKKIE